MRIWAYCTVGMKQLPSLTWAGHVWTNLQINLHFYNAVLVISGPKLQNEKVQQPDQSTELSVLRHNNNAKPQSTNTANLLCCYQLSLFCYQSSNKVQAWFKKAIKQWPGRKWLQHYWCVHLDKEKHTFVTASMIHLQVFLDGRDINV